MENAAEVNDCFFRWCISDPFLPRRDLEATFNLRSPTVTLWKVTLQPVARSVNYWEFYFSLEFEERCDRRREIVVGRLMVQIFLDGIEITGNEVFNQRFYTDNRFKYDFKSSASITAQTEEHCLIVIIEISLVDSAGKYEGGNKFFDMDDLRCLSSNLNLLQNDPHYSNMMLIPKSSQVPICAHSYIINARWNNFFAFHDFEAGIRPRVETNISRAVLKDILSYMYSGTFGLTWPDWTEAAYTTELFKVIDRYKLYHLYEVFVKHDLMQLRATRNSGISESRLFPLDFIHGRQVTNTSHTWRVVSSTEYVLNFQFQVRNQAFPWLSYSLQSLSSSKVYAKVNMEVIKRVNSNPLGKPLLFHEKDFIIEPETTVDSECVLFLGCTETFGHPGGAEMKYFIRCFLNVTDGTTVEQIRSVPGDTLLDQLSVLSDHMLRLRRQPVDFDIRIVGRHFDRRGKRIYYSIEKVHKGILAIRVPEWWEGLINVSPANDLPETALSHIRRDSLSVFHDYMYTGKIVGMPISFLREIAEFARRTLFFSLSNLVDRVLSDLRNRGRRR